MAVYCQWRFIVSGGLLSVAVYCQWRFIVSGGLLSVAVYCQWRFIVSGGCEDALNLLSCFVPEAVDAS